jgi:hypothetical protein
MAGKIGEGRLGKQIDLGWDEIGGLFFQVSNIVQPAHSFRGNYGTPKEADAVEPDKPEPSFEELHPVGPGRDDHDRDDRDHGIERE